MPAPLHKLWPRLCLALAILLVVVAGIFNMTALSPRLRAATLNAATPGDSPFELLPTPVPGSSPYATRQQVVSGLLAIETTWPDPYAGAQLFADVPPQFATQPAINKAYGYGLLDAYACGGLMEPCLAQQQQYFRPNSTITRAEFAKLISLAAGWALGSSCGATVLTDVPCGSAYYPYILAATSRGYLHGSADGKFQPDQPILTTDVHFPPAASAPQQTKPRPQPTTTVATRGNRFGADIVQILNSVNLDGSLLSSPAGLRAANAGIVRYRLPWGRIQPKSNSDYVWDSGGPRQSPDQILKAFADQGVNVLLEFGSVPQWACRTLPPDGSGGCERHEKDVIADEHFADYFKFVRAAVARYSVPPYSVTMIEIINEPDRADRWGKFVPQYERLLQGAHDEIHSIPSARNIPVMIGGVADATSGFLARILTDVPTATDAINFHLYDFNMVNYGWWRDRLAAIVGNIRKLPNAAGKPLVLSESGTNSQPDVRQDSSMNCVLPAKPGVPTNVPANPTTQASYVARLLNRALSLDIGTTIWYPLHDGGQPCGFQYNGLVDLSSNPKPSYYVYQNVAWELQPGGPEPSRQYIGPLTCAQLPGACANAEGYAIDRQVAGDANHGAVWAWSNNNPANVSVAIPVTGTQLIGFMGQDGAYGCLVANDDCETSHRQWVWPRPHHPEDQAPWDSGEAVEALLADIYAP